ncbi:MAG: NTP transferase domain-containing protein [candidate division WOR-3 bacterium]
MTGIILAAGKSKRMGLAHSKVLLPLNGRPLISWVVELAQQANLSPIIVVVSPNSNDIQKVFAGADIQFVVQKEQKGTADAVLSCAEKIAMNDDIFVLYGDTPLLTLSTIKQLIKTFYQETADAVLLTAELEKPSGYGRIVRDGARIVAIIEDRDADEQIRKIKEINVGVYAFKYSKLYPILKTLKPSPINGEYYLTSAINELINQGGNVKSIVTDNPNEILGVNTPEDWELVKSLFHNQNK